MLQPSKKDCYLNLFNHSCLIGGVLFVCLEFAMLFAC